jgi:hypothetical protein
MSRNFKYLKNLVGFVSREFFKKIRDHPMYKVSNTSDTTDRFYSEGKMR